MTCYVLFWTHCLNLTCCLLLLDMRKPWPSQLSQMPLALDSFPLFFSFCSAEDHIQHFVHPRQVLCHWPTPAAPSVHSLSPCVSLDLTSPLLITTCVHPLNCISFWLLWINTPTNPFWARNSPHYSPHRASASPGPMWPGARSQNKNWLAWPVCKMHFGKKLIM
jgi:hypothetical protein